jgi:hypothetical protein
MSSRVIQFPGKEDYTRAVAVLAAVPWTRVGLPDFKMVVTDDHVKALDQSGIPYTELTKDGRHGPTPPVQP